MKTCSYCNQSGSGRYCSACGRQMLWDNHSLLVVSGSLATFAREHAQDITESTYDILMTYAAEIDEAVLAREFAEQGGVYEN